MTHLGLVLPALCFVGSLVAPPPADAGTSQNPLPQTAPSAGAVAPGRLRVYLDCSDCFPTYLREEIKWVDFVRQPQDADLTLLASSQETGSGGREVTLRFVGRGSRLGVDHEHRALSLPGETEDTRRRAVLRAVQVGLLDYLSDVGLPADLSVTVREAESTGKTTTPQADPWRLWVFSVGADGSYEAEEASRERRVELNLSADRVTDAWKVSFGAQLDRQLQQFDLDEDEPFESRRRSSSVEGFAAKSLGPHWSLGLSGQIETSTFNNREFSAQVAPAIEYSIFPYRDYATRQLVVEYTIGMERARYNEVTLFDKVKETLGGHEISLRLDQRQPWGSLEARVEFFQYLHDLSLNRLEVNGEVDVRVARGLTLSFDGRASRIRDQLSLPRRSASAEEVLLRLRQLQSGYNVEVSFGLRYSFGSIFNNVVNPRFGGWSAARR